MGVLDLSHPDRPDLRLRHGRSRHRHRRFPRPPFRGVRPPRIQRHPARRRGHLHRLRGHPHARPVCRIGQGHQGDQPRPARGHRGRHPRRLDAHAALRCPSRTRGIRSLAWRRVHLPHRPAGVDAFGRGPQSLDQHLDPRTLQANRVQTRPPRGRSGVQPRVCLLHSARHLLPLARGIAAPHPRHGPAQRNRRFCSRHHRPLHGGARKLEHALCGIRRFRGHARHLHRLPRWIQPQLQPWHRRPSGHRGRHPT